MEPAHSWFTRPYVLRAYAVTMPVVTFNFLSDESINRKLFYFKQQNVKIKCGSNNRERNWLCVICFPEATLLFKLELAQTSLENINRGGIELLMMLPRASLFV